MGGLLLPVGLWLLLSAGTPSQLHRRLAVASLIALATATLAYIAFGFAFAFGGSERSLGIGAAPERWVFVGLSGFFLEGATNAEGLRTWVRFWPLIAAGAVLVAGALAQQARVFALVIFTAVVAGVVLPVAMCWVWGDGWLHRLGANAGFGQGTVDVGWLAALGVAAGAAGVVWLRSMPRRELGLHEPELPAVHFPVRAVAGVLLVLAGAPAFAGAFAPDVPELPLGQFVNSSVAVSAAILTAGGYAIFTTRRPDVLSASRAAAAAVLAMSSGGALLPMLVVVALGVVCGLLATLGYYLVNERWRWRDDSAIATSVFAPAATGLLATGLFANGAFGVAGLLSSGAIDAGQFLAQGVGLTAIALMATALSGAALGLMRLARVPLLIPLETAYAQSPAPQPAPVSVAVATAEFSAPGQAVSLTYASVSDASDLTSIDQPPIETESPVVEEAMSAMSGARRRGWFSRFRQGNETAPAPKQPRKVAYPYRVGGRPLSARPPSVSASDAGNEAEPRDDRT